MVKREIEMAVRMLFLSALLVGGAMVVCSTKVETSEDAVLYLRKYGYLQPVSSEDETYQVAEEVMKEAICHFQYMFNLVETCKLDDETMAMMNVPRCGMPDVESHEIGLRNPKRYYLRSKWSKTALTYRVDSVTRDLSSYKVKSIIAKALTFWSDASKLTFRRVGTSSSADITINFNTGNHGDGNSFDGKGGTLAHAYYPQDGRAHFDDAETFTDRSSSGTNLLYVAVHEFGHSLGLGHSSSSNSVMAPRIQPYDPNFKLTSDDINGIRAHYGA